MNTVSVTIELEENARAASKAFINIASHFGDDDVKTQEIMRANFLDVTVTSNADFATEDDAGLDLIVKWGLIPVGWVVYNKGTFESKDCRPSVNDFPLVEPAHLFFADNPQPEVHTDDGLAKLMMDHLQGIEAPSDARLACHSLRVCVDIIKAQRLLGNVYIEQAWKRKEHVVFMRRALLSRNWVGLLKTEVPKRFNGEQAGLAFMRGNVQMLMCTKFTAALLNVLYEPYGTAWCDIDSDLTPIARNEIDLKSDTAKRNVVLVHIPYMVQMLSAIGPGAALTDSYTYTESTRRMRKDIVDLVYEHLRVKVSPKRRHMSLEFIAVDKAESLDDKRPPCMETAHGMVTGKNTNAPDADRSALYEYYLRHGLTHKEIASLHNSYVQGFHHDLVGEQKAIVKKEIQEAEANLRKRGAHEMTCETLAQDRVCPFKGCQRQCIKQLCEAINVPPSDIPKFNGPFTYTQLLLNNEINGIKPNNPSRLTIKRPSDDLEW